MKLLQIERKVGKIYLLLHIGILFAVLLFPLYRQFTDHLTKFFAGCFLHDRLFLYCPLCGGTRALEATMHFDFLAALRYNSFVTLLIFLLVILDIWAFIRLLRGKENILPLPGWFWIVLVIVMILYAVLRNYLMLTYGHDPVGDLGAFWSRISVAK